MIVLCCVVRRGCARYLALLSFWPAVRLGWSATAGTDGTVVDGGFVLLGFCWPVDHLGWSNTSGVYSGCAAMGGAWLCSFSSAGSPRWPVAAGLVGRHGRLLFLADDRGFGQGEELGPTDHTGCLGEMHYNIL